MYRYCVGDRYGCVVGPNEKNCIDKLKRYYGTKEKIRVWPNQNDNSSDIAEYYVRDASKNIMEGWV